MAIDLARIHQFLSQGLLRTEVGKVVRAAGFEISWVVDEDSSPARWWLALKLNAKLKQVLGTRREVVVYVVEASEFQARSVMQAYDAVRSEANRFCEDFAVLITNDSNTPAGAAEASQTLPLAVVGVHSSELSTLKPFGPGSFVDRIRTSLFQKDLYSIASPLATRSGFYGRRELITDSVTSLKECTSNIGVFGLRKMGKTSLLLQIANRLRHSASTIVSRIDVQRIDALYPSLEYLLWSVGESLVDSKPRLLQRANLEMFGKHRRFADVPDASAVPELFDSDLRHILNSNQQLTACLMFDEIELMAPSNRTPSHGWQDSFVRLWRLLRGLAQEHAGRISYLVVGTNPNVFEQNYVTDRENPAFNYLSIAYLPRLTHEEMELLLTELGRRMGLRWEPSAAEKVYDLTGGHPFLTRKLGSLVHRSMSPRDNEMPVDLKTIEHLLPKFLSEVSPFLRQMLDVLRDQYQDDFYLLQLLANGRIGEFRALSTEMPDAIHHLRGYGILGETEFDNNLPISALQSWLQQQPSTKRAEPNRDIHRDANRIGDTVADYEIVAEIGDPGGFARVFAAKNVRDESDVALKILRNASLDLLQREVEAIESIKHPSIVQVLDFGKSEAGDVFLVMELLRGPSLRKLCNRAARWSVADATIGLDQLLSALDHIHPDQDRVAELREMPDLSEDDYALLNESRHGIVHRDIKPENIILCRDRGPVLIDFGISVRAEEHVRTISSTPGYLPPDGVGQVWTPDVDLFQLGITITQAVLGRRLESLEDMRVQLSADVADPLRSVLLKMTALDRSTRYLSAKAALKDLRSSRA